MRCEDCKDLLSNFIDGELDHSSASVVREHLAFCADCEAVYSEMTAIVDTSKAFPSSEVAPPNSEAMWRRINNILECEIKPAVEPLTEKGRRRFSFLQLASAVIGIAVISSLLTIVGIKNYMTPAANDFTSRSSESQTTIEKLMSRIGLIDSPQAARQRRIAEQEAAIDYWNKRVETRRAQWDARMREAFDRNLNIINESVNDYTLILQQDPDDEITSEMLDSALDEKMNLLREFAEL